MLELPAADRSPELFPLEVVPPVPVPPALGWPEVEPAQADRSDAKLSIGARRFISRPTAIGIDNNVVHGVGAKVALGRIRGRGRHTLRAQDDLADAAAETVCGRARSGKVVVGSS